MFILSAVSGAVSMINSCANSKLKFVKEICKMLITSHRTTIIVLMQHAWSGDSLPAVTFKKLHDLLFFFRPGISHSYQI